MQRKIVLVCVVVLLAFSLAPKFFFGQGNCKSQHYVQYKTTVSNSVLTTFRIGIYYGPVLEFTNDEQYQIIKDANIDFIQNVDGHYEGNYSAKSNLKMLALAQKHGLKILVCDPRVKGSDDDLEDMVNTYKNHPALEGYFVKDEPFIPTLDEAAGFVKKLAALDPGKIYHVNFNSIDAVPVNYEKDYVEAWVQKAGPENLAYISVDAYPFGSGDKFLDTSFYKTMDILRRVGLKYDVKTSAYLQSIGFSIHGVCYRRRPNPDELRQNVYTTLAYGIKYPVWFTYWGAKKRSPQYEDYTAAIIDTFGNKTDLYAPFQKLNMEMKQLGKTLFDLDAKDVYHTAPEIPAGMISVPTDYLVPLPPDFIIQPEDKSADLIITNFIHREKKSRYVMIVNKSFKESKTLSFRLNSQVKKLKQVSESTGAEIPVTIDKTDHSIRQTFLPGQGKLFFVE